MNTRFAHRILCYIFLAFQLIATTAVCIIMTRSNETMEKMLSQVGSLYDALKYSEDNKFARFYPVWFMLKRYLFVAMVFNFEYTHGMILFSLFINLVDFMLMNHGRPYEDEIENKIELFNLGFAYSFLIVLQIFT